MSASLPPIPKKRFQVTKLPIILVLELIIVILVRRDRKTGKNQFTKSHLKVLTQGYLPQRNGGKKKISKGNISHFNMLYKERWLKGNLAGNFIPLNF